MGVGLVKSFRARRFTHGSTASVSTRPGGRLPLLAVTAAVSVLGYRYFRFISDYAVNVLFYDQWDFLNAFFQGDAGITRLFWWQHGPVRLGIGLIADKYLYSLTSWNVRAESFLIGACVFGAMLLALVLKRALFGHLSHTDIAIPLMFLTLTQYETLIGTPNVAYSGIPLLLILLYSLALLQRRPAVRYTFILGLNLLLIYTGMGLFMGPITMALFAFEFVWRLRWPGSGSVGSSALALLVASASQALFFLDYRFRPAVECFAFPAPDLTSYPRFMAIMFMTFLDPLGRLPTVTAVGSVILLFAFMVLGVQFYRLRKGGPAGAPLVGASLLAFSLLFAASTAVGRVCLGLPGAAQSSRYTSLLAPAFLAMYFYLLTVSSPRLRNLGLATLMLGLVPGHAIVSPGAHWFADGKRAWSTCYLRAQDVGYCDQTTMFNVYPSPERTGLGRKLDYLKQNRLSLFSNVP